MNVIRMVKNMILVYIISAAISSCAGQGKTETKHKALGQSSVGEIVGELPTNTHLIYHDKNDNYWFGNDNGTYKYDGITLLIYTQKDGLVSNRIIEIQEDKLGNIYFDTPEGVSMFDGQLFKTLEVFEDHSKENKWKSEQDDLWFRIGWDQKGPYRFDGKNLHQLEFPKSKIEDDFYKKYPNASYNPYSIYSMYKDSNGNLWFGTADLGIYQFDGTQLRWMHEEHLGTAAGGGAFGIRSISEDKDGYFWICNTNYKYKVFPDSEGGDEKLRSLIYEKEKGAIAKNEEVLYFFSMLLDDKGILWMVNNEGIWKNDGQELVEFFVNDGERDIIPSSVYEDNKGNLWFGTQSEGIYKYNGVDFEKAVFNSSDSRH